MANITSYPAISSLADGDLIVVSDANTTNNATRTTTVGKLASFVGSTQTLGYKTYVASLTASGGAPTVVEFQNQLGGITWAFTTAGTWTATSSGAFTSAKTTVFVQANNVTDPSIGPNGANGVAGTNIYPNQAITSISSVNEVVLTNFSLAQSGGSKKNNILDCNIEIKVYD